MSAEQIQRKYQKRYLRISFIHKISDKKSINEIKNYPISITIFHILLELIFINKDVKVLKIIRVGKNQRCGKISSLGRYENFIISKKDKS